MPKTTVTGPVLSGPLTTTERKGYVVSAIAIPFTCTSLPTVASAGTLVGYLPANTSIISAVVNQTATTDLRTEYVQLGFTATPGNPGQYDCTYAQLTGVGVRFITLYDANVNKAKWRDVGTTKLHYILQWMLLVLQDLELYTYLLQLEQIIWMLRNVLILIMIILPIKSFADATAANEWVSDISGGWDVASKRKSNVECGQTLYYAFGTGTGHTTSGSTAVLRVNCPNGATLVFDPHRGGTGAGTASINAIYQVVEDSTTNTSIIFCLNALIAISPF